MPESEQLPGELVRARLAAGEPAVGTWLYGGQPDVAEMLARQGFDWLLFDLEHGTASPETVVAQMQAMGDAADALVRVAPGAWADAGRMLDAGAAGIVFPMIEEAASAARAVAACRYPPAGRRGMGPRRCAAYGDRFDEYVAGANNAVVVVVQIETPRAVANVAEIAAVPGVDVAAIGMGDLTALMGRFREREHADVLAARAAVLAACAANGVAPGLAYAGDGAAAAAGVAEGFRFIGLGSDDGFLLRGANEALSHLGRVAG